MKVIFRWWPEADDVIALFPEHSADYSGRFCVCYQHVGQHGSADLEYMMGETRPATFAEALPLYEELREIGYNDLCPVDDIDHQLAYERRLVVLREMEE